MTRPCLLVDLDRCTGCQSCVVACREQKGTPAGVNLIRVVQIGPEGIFPHLNMYYLPVACQECEAPACAAACPEGAISRSSNDVVTVDVDKCNGCGECVAPCPYGAIVLDSAAALARKCDLCVEVWPENGQRTAGGSRRVRASSLCRHRPRRAVRPFPAGVARPLLATRHPIAVWVLPRTLLDRLILVRYFR
jgi:Fe-S-cluster-containing dehydrogenase component